MLLKKKIWIKDLVGCFRDRGFACSAARPNSFFAVSKLIVMDFDVRVFLIVQHTFNNIVESCYRAILQSFFA